MREVMFCLFHRFYYIAFLFVSGRNRVSVSCHNLDPHLSDIWTKISVRNSWKLATLVRNSSAPLHLPSHHASFLPRIPAAHTPTPRSRTSSSKRWDSNGYYTDKLNLKKVMDVSHICMRPKEKKNSTHVIRDSHLLYAESRNTSYFSLFHQNFSENRIFPWERGFSKENWIFKN